MDAERRYSDDEVARIFERAAVDEPETRTSGSETGMTLAELQEIGREVGIPPERIAGAAAALAAGGPSVSPPVRFLGVPIGVGVTVHLDRRLTDEEWGRLVVDLRETFDARGRIRMEGPFRSWSNGNLQALLEPTESGERLRLRTLKGDARASLGLGATLLTIVPVVLVLLALTGTLGAAGNWELPALFAAVGAVLFGGARLNLPRWAETRELQMRGIAGRLEEAIQTPEPRRLDRGDGPG